MLEPWCQCWLELVSNDYLYIMMEEFIQNYNPGNKFAKLNWSEDVFVNTSDRLIQSLGSIITFACFVVTVHSCWLVNILHSIVIMIVIMVIAFLINIAIVAIIITV